MRGFHGQHMPHEKKKLLQMVQKRGSASDVKTSCQHFSIAFF